LWQECYELNAKAADIIIFPMRMALPLMADSEH